MHSHSVAPRRLAGVLPLSPLFVGFCAYVLLFWFVVVWIWLVVGVYPSTLKFVALGPALGPLNLVAILSIVHAVWAVLFAAWIYRYWRTDSQSRWVTLFSVLPILAVLISLELCNRTAAAAAATYDNDRVRTDAEMLDHFSSHEKDWAKAVDLVRESTYVREHQNPIIVTNWVFTDEVTWRSWQHNCRSILGIKHDILASDGASRITFLQSVNATGPTGTFKGYVWSEKPLAPLVPSLDDVDLDHEPVTCYRIISGHWYLFVRNHR